MFNNVAPVLPEAALAAIERVLSNADKGAISRCGYVKRLLRSLAYDPPLFERAISLLLKFIDPDELDNSDDEATSLIVSFFHIYLSGTHATCEQRLRLIEIWLRSPHTALQTIGVRALKAMMETSHFSSSYNFEFGARSRDYGYLPKTTDEIRNWFSAVLKLAETFAVSESLVSKEVAKAIADEFRGLWANAERFDDLERVAQAIGSKRFWREGWISARQTRYFHSKDMSPDALERLTKLEGFLRPTNLVNKVRGIVLNASGGGLDLDDFEEEDNGDYEAAVARLSAIIDNLGKDFANDDQSRKILLSELIGGSGKLSAFGHGLALGAENPRELWKELVAEFAASERPNIQLLNGYLNGLQQRDASGADALLDEALDDDTLAEWFPILQANVVIDKKESAVFTVP